MIKSTSTRQPRPTPALPPEGLCRDMIDRSPVGMYVLQRGRFVFANRHLAAMFGYSVDELLALPSPMGIVHPDDRALVDERVRRRTAGAVDQVHYRFQGVRRNGERIDVEVRGAASEYAGHPAVTGAMVDITQRTRLEHALRSADELHQAVYDLAPDMFVEVDPDSERIINCNQALVSATGFDKTRLIGRSVFDLYHPDCADQARAVSREFVRDGRVHDAELRVRRRDGSAFDASLSVSGKRDGTGRIVLSILVLRDNTDRRQAAADLAAARDAAREASRAKTAFLATMSHEIRTPMNGVIGMTGLLLDTALTAEQRDYAQTVRQSGEALLTIINDILDFSKVEAGQVGIEMIEFDLRAAIDEVAHLLAEQAHGKSLELTAFVDPAIPVRVEGDPGRIRQVLTNLAGNAIKFTDRGEVVIRATVDEETSERVIVRITVEDTGIGIPDAVQARLFTPFSQGDDSTTRVYGGTGLGLAISKQLVELMHGVVGVSSEPGRGSRFWFTLPLEKRAATPSRADPATVQLGGLRVLIVDDNANNRQLLEQQLRADGMIVDSCGDGATALARLHDRQSTPAAYALAVVDFFMPGMDGLTVARRAKADPVSAGCPMVLLTSTAQRGEAAEAEAAGFAGYLTKPIRQVQLLAAIRSVLAEAGAPSGSPPALVTRHTVAEGRQPGARVLLVEDNRVNQKVATLMLEQQGCLVDLAVNGREAVDAVRSHPYDLVFMDCQMPELDGFEATAQIRRRETGDRRLAIIAMTANVMEGDRERCLSAGMDDYVAKPLTRQGLEDLLDRWRGGANRVDRATELDGGALVVGQSRTA